MTHLHDLCKNLLALSPGYYKMDGSYVEIGLEAANEIERFVKELEYTKIACERLREDRDEAAEVIERFVRFVDLPDGGNVSLAEQVSRIKEVLEEAEAALAQSDAEDKPIGFRTWDVPNPYAEGPQSDDEPTGEVYDKIKGHAVTQSDAEPDARKKLEEATVYAEQLATSLAARWYPEVSQWKPLRGDLIGLLTQIDNMTTGAVRAQSDAEPVAWQLVPKEPTREMLSALYNLDAGDGTMLGNWKAMLAAAPARAADRSRK